MKTKFIAISIIVCIHSFAVCHAQEIHQAVQRGDLAKVNELLEKNPELIEEKNNFEFTPLISASAGGHLEIVKLLLQKGADVNAEDYVGWSSLHRAASRGNLEVVKLLVENGAKTEDKTNDVELPLNLAGGNGHRDVVEFLLKKGTDVNYRKGDGHTVLTKAIMYGKREVAELLISKRADVNVKVRYNITSLHYAAAGGHRELVELLIEKGAHLNSRSTNGFSPLNFAEYYGHKEIVDFLISKGADRSTVKFPPLSGEYMGMQKPGLTPEVFAPGLLRAIYAPHSCLTISPDGKEMYWTSAYGGLNGGTWFVEEENGRWTKPQISPLSDQFSYGMLSFSPDGKKLFYSDINDIWYVERKGNDWGESKKIVLPNSTDKRELFPSISANGNVYFSRNGDIYMSRYINGKYSPPENLGNSVNSNSSENCPYIAPDESFILFNSTRPENISRGNNLYICFRKKDRTWIKAINMGKEINSSSCGAPSLSKDGKYFFFFRRKNGIDDFYWVDTKIIEALKPDELK